MSKAGIETAQVDLDVVRAIIEEAAKHLTPDKAEVLGGLLESHVTLLRLLRERGTTIRRLRRLFGLSKTERLEALSTKPDGDEEKKATTDSAENAIASCRCGRRRQQRGRARHRGRHRRTGARPSPSPARGRAVGARPTSTRAPRPSCPIPSYTAATPARTADTERSTRPGPSSSS